MGEMGMGGWMGWKGGMAVGLGWGWGDGMGLGMDGGSECAPQEHGADEQEASAPMDTNGSEMDPKWKQKLTRNVPQMEAKMEPEWIPNGSQNRPQMGPEMSEMDPNWEPK